MVHHKIQNTSAGKKAKDVALSLALASSITKKRPSEEERSTD